MGCLSDKKANTSISWCVSKAAADESLKQAAQANHIDDFKAIFEKAFEGLVIDRMEGNEDIFSRLMSDPAFRGMAANDVMRKIYRFFNRDDNDEGL